MTDPTSDEGARAVPPAAPSFDGLVAQDPEPDADRRRGRRAPTRRAVVRGALLAAAGGSLAIVGGVWAASRRTAAQVVTTARAVVRLPSPSAADAVPAGATPSVLADLPATTPVADFFRIDISATAPLIDTATWRLSVEGDVAKTLSLSYDDLLARPAVTRAITLSCVSDPVGGDLVGTAVWQGVRLQDLLDDAGISSTATRLVSVSQDGFTTWFPLAAARDGREALVAYAMNGEPLTAEHGWPARLVVPGLYGYVSATKWLTTLRLTGDDGPSGFWEERGWSTDGTALAASRIDVPRASARVTAGAVTVAGRAWHPHVGVRGVQVRVDDGPWQDAVTAPGVGTDDWRLWTCTWQATAGHHGLTVRTLSSDGTVQSATERDAYPGAATGLHTVQVTVSGA